jgi:putative transposase
MPDYLRAWLPGGTFFFTVNLLQRQGNELLTRHIEVLRRVVRDVKRRHPFVIHGWVVLPEHLHCVIELPPDDVDFALRWRLIKMDFSKAMPLTERRNASRLKRGERGIWQRRYWEHRIRGEADFRAHMDYVHITW